jgi:hypothetical protein
MTAEEARNLTTKLNNFKSLDYTITAINERIELQATKCLSYSLLIHYVIDKELYKHVKFYEKDIFEHFKNNGFRIELMNYTIAPCYCIDWS